MPVQNDGEPLRVDRRRVFHKCGRRCGTKPIVRGLRAGGPSRTVVDEVHGGAARAGVRSRVAHNVFNGDPTRSSGHGTCRGGPKFCRKGTDRNPLPHTCERRLGRYRTERRPPFHRSSDRRCSGLLRLLPSTVHRFFRRCPQRHRNPVDNSAESGDNCFSGAGTWSARQSSVHL